MDLEYTPGKSLTLVDAPSHMAHHLRRKVTQNKIYQFTPT